jgi:hypothetical protein
MKSVTLWTLSLFATFVFVGAAAPASAEDVRVAAAPMEVACPPPTTDFDPFHAVCELVLGLCDFIFPQCPVQ